MAVDEKAKKVAAKLAKIREREDLSLKPTPHLKQTFTDFDGTERELKIRYYQVQGILHLIFMKRFLLGDDTGLGKCVTGDTLLQTDRGLIPISELAPLPKDQLKAGSFYEPAFPVKVWTGARWSPVNRFYYDGIRPTKRVTTQSGFRVEGSHKHPLMARDADGDGWKRLPDLAVGDYLHVDRSPVPKSEWAEDPDIKFEASFGGNAKSYTIPEKMTPELARLLGYIVAEGHCPNKYRVEVSQHDPEPHEDIRALFKSVFGWEGNFENDARDISIRVPSVQIRAFMEACGITGTLSAGKRVPPLLMRSSMVSTSEFLRGYFEGDGHVLSCGGVEVTSASEGLLRDVQVLLLRFGIVSVLRPKKVQGYDHTYWRLTLFGEDAHKFRFWVGFVSSRKQAALSGNLPSATNPNRDVVPHAKGLVEALRTEIHARCGRQGGGISKRWGSAFYNTLGHIRAGRRNPTYPYLVRMLGIAREVGVPSDHPSVVAVEQVCSRGVFYDPVVSIEDGHAEVMDIEVDDPDHCFVGNGLVNHNTLQTIAALCYIWEKDPGRKALVLTTKSATPQWAKEFGKFTKGVRVIVAKGTRKQRERAYEAWRRSDKPTVMVMGYRSAVNDIRKLQDDEGYILVTDEATAYKNPKTQVHQCVRHMSEQADRIWALTATLIKNHLMEGHGIYQVVLPGLFGSANTFMYYYCIVEMMQIGRGRKVPRIVGYHPDKVVEFRDKIQPYYLGRPKHAVAKELPTLIREVYEVGLSKVQESKYKEALSGLLYVGETRAEGEEEKEVTKLTAIGYCQQIVNHPTLIECEGASEKMDSLIDLLTNGKLEGEKVIIFSRFKKMVNLLMPALKKAKLHPVRVTGDENEDERQAAQDAFQNPNNPCKVICITSAGGEGINLQAAKAIVFYDTPWSAGEYLQVLGRMIRIGSKHANVLAIHMVAKLSTGAASIDQRVMDVINTKMKLIEAVIGERLKGIDTDKKKDERIEVRSEVRDIFDALQGDAKGGK